MSSDYININTIRQLLQVEAKSPNFLDKMTSGYFTSWESHAPQIKRAIFEGSHDSARELLHKLKGHSAMIGFKKIAECLQGFEDDLNPQCIKETSSQWMTTIRNINELTKKELNQFLAEEKK